MPREVIATHVTITSHQSWDWKYLEKFALLQAALNKQEETAEEEGEWFAMGSAKHRPCWRPLAVPEMTPFTKVIFSLVVLGFSESGCFSKLWDAVIEHQSFRRRLVSAASQAKEHVGAVSVPVLLQAGTVKAGMGQCDGGTELLQRRSHT